MSPELLHIAARLGESLAAQGWRIVTAESCTAGLVAAAITEVAGSSAWFERGYVTYSNTAKQEMLGVLGVTLAQHGAVSEACVREMALGALSRSHADVAVAISGIAGPTGGTPDKPVGMVCFGWATMLGVVHTATAYFDGDRSSVRDQAACLALEGVLRIASSNTDYA